MGTAPQSVGKPEQINSAQRLQGGEQAIAGRYDRAQAENGKRCVESHAEGMGPGSGKTINPPAAETRTDYDGQARAGGGGAGQAEAGETEPLPQRHSVVLPLISASGAGNACDRHMTVDPSCAN